MTRPRILLASSLVLAFALVARADDPPAVGEPRWIAGHWFQHLGTDERGRTLWLLPHMDGVPEVFAAPRRGAWSGSLGSRFDPADGTFDERFNAAEVAIELRGATSARARREAARLLGAFLALHPAPAPPIYLRELAGEVAAALTDDDAAAVAATIERHRALLARVRAPGVRILARPAPLLSADDHLAALIEDGYLDVAVVGGNSRDPESGERHSADLLGDLAHELERQGFAAARFRRAQDRALRERVVELLGRPVRVRVLLAGGSARDDRVRRAVAAFVEGLAFADVVLYLGQSNGDTGRYHLSEAKEPWASFHLGEGGRDLAEKCHLLGRRAHQLVVLHSCSSFDKYVRPLTAFCAAQPGATPPGVIGTATPAYFDEFVPRYAAFFSLLARGAGPVSIVRALREAPRRPDAAPLVVRGFLQPRDTFVVPPGVVITGVEEVDGLPFGVGSDGERYPSTEVFPQDRPGDVVQAVTWARGVVGLGRDGRLVRVGPDTGGECVEASPRHLALRVVGVVRERLVAIDATGRVHVAGDRGLVPLDPAPPAPVVAIGEPDGGAPEQDASGPRGADDNEIVAIDARGGAWTWRGGGDRWEPRRGDLRLRAAPSLLSRRAPGSLWLGDEGGRVVDLTIDWQVDDPFLSLPPPR